MPEGSTNYYQQDVEQSSFLPTHPCAPRRAFHRALSRIACALVAALVVERCVLAHRGWAGAIVEILDHPVCVPPPSQHSIHKRGGTTAESRFPKNRDRGHAHERVFPGCQSRMGGGLERDGSQDDRRRAEVEKTEQRYAAAADGRVLCRRQARVEHWRQ